MRDCLADTHEALCVNKHNVAIYLLQIDEANAQILVELQVTVLVKQTQQDLGSDTEENK